MAEISLVPLVEINKAARWDAEAYKPVLREMDTAFNKAPHLFQLATVTHPSEIPRVYSTGENGKPFILAQNIKPLLPDMATTFYIPPDTYNGIPINKLQTNDVLVTRSGAFSGISCVYLGKTGETYTSGEGIIVRSLGNIDGAYLATFFSTKYGLQLCQRAIYGSGQPHISPKYLAQAPIPRLGNIEDKVSDLVRQAFQKIEKASYDYPEAEAELLERMGWEKLAKQPVELSYIEKYDELQEHDRIDAEHFQPQYKRLRKHLQKDGAMQISEFCPQPKRGVQPEFVDNGDVLVIDSKAVRPQGVEPSNERTDMTFYTQENNAKGRVQKGDVLLNSTGRGTLGRAACYQIDKPALADNHVAIIRPNKQVCIPEYLSLFLNSPAGLAQSEMYQAGSSGQLELYPQHIMQFLIYLPKNKNGSIDIEWQKKLADKVISASKAKAEAQAKLEEAKRMVEEAIKSSLGDR